eukprot:1069584-Amphidinium_carterae.2
MLEADEQNPLVAKGVTMHTLSSFVHVQNACVVSQGVKLHILCGKESVGIAHLSLTRVRTVRPSKDSKLFGI